ncbi:ABC transporter ATP-binding protein [Neobacillus sp. D3-1R]|uniref:ABC transporter ATP-binding protein n=1 Tax=Neobacillus sp. D3-1R TaxID=3445778 RepID=UPI003F9F6088
MLDQQKQQLIKHYFNLNDFKKTYTLLKPFILAQWKAYVVLLILLVVDIFFTIAYAWFFGNLTDAAVHGNMDRLKELVPIGVFLTLLSIISSYCGIYFETVASNGLKNNLKEYLFEHILRLPAGETSKIRSGDIISYFNNDIHSVDGVTGSTLISLIRIPLIFLAVFIYLFQINWVLCLSSVLIAPIAIAGGVFFGLLLKKNGRKIHQLVAEINSTLSETFQGLQVIRSFTLEKAAFITFKSKNKKYYKLELENAKLQGWYYSGGYLVNSIAFLFNLCLGAFFVSKGEMSVGSLLTFINLVGHLVYPMTGLAGQWAGFQRSITAIERLIDLLERPTVSKELSTYVPTIKEVSSIQFQDVSFSYDDTKIVFKEFNLDIPAGKMIAFVGPSGAGKTTLFNLLQGFYQPQLGKILINGKPIELLSVSELRSSIAHVPQETFLFAGTIKENLVLARPNITKNEMIHAAKSANIHDFIISLSDGYETEIGERGIKLSGGQKQRIAIARAILKNAPILLLDEATSALDGETEYHVKEELEQLMKDKTTLVIAHRLSTIQNADLIVVISNGKIEQMGNHEQLLNQDGLYQKLYNSSFKDNAAKPVSYA